MTKEQEEPAKKTEPRKKEVWRPFIPAPINTRMWPRSTEPREHREQRPSTRESEKNE